MQAQPRRLRLLLVEDLLNVLTRVRGYSTAATFIRGELLLSTTEAREAINLKKESIFFPNIDAPCTKMNDLTKRDTNEKSTILTFVHEVESRAHSDLITKIYVKMPTISKTKNIHFHGKDFLLMLYTVHSVEKQEIISHQKNISSNQLFSN